MSSSLYWMIESHELRPLTAQLRSRLVALYGYTAGATHTHVALVQVRREGHEGVEVIAEFPFSVRAQDWQGRTGELEDAIDSEIRTRLLAVRNADPLTSILDRRHPL